MTDDMDANIKAALEKEEQEIFAKFGDEPGLLEQTFGKHGLFRGPLAWTLWYAAFLQFLSVAAFVFAIIKVYQSTETVEVIRWGVLTVIFASSFMFIQSMIAMGWHANRLLREIYRIEVQFAQFMASPAARDQGDDTA